MAGRLAISSTATNWRDQPDQRATRINCYVFNSYQRMTHLGYSLIYAKNRSFHG